MQTDEVMTKILATPLCKCVCVCVLMQQLPWRCGHAVHWCLVSTQRQTHTIAYYTFVCASGLVFALLI